MPDNKDEQMDLIRILIPGPIKVDILGTESIEFDAPVLRWYGAESLTSDQMTILQVMIKMISQLNID